MGALEKYPNPQIVIIVEKLRRSVNKGVIIEISAIIRIIMAGRIR